MVSALRIVDLLISYAFLTKYKDNARILAHFRIPALT